MNRWGAILGVAALAAACPVTVHAQSADPAPSEADMAADLLADLEAEEAAEALLEQRQDAVGEEVLEELAGAEGMAMTAIRASDPQRMAALLVAYGLEVELTTDSYGDPQLITDFAGWRGSVDFYDCDPERNDECGSIQFNVGFDRSEPMSLEQVNKVMAERRFASVHVDEEGDPWVQWDIITGAGIPAPVFLEAYERFAMQVETIADVVFEEERDRAAPSATPMGTALPDPV